MAHIIEPGHAGRNQPPPPHYLLVLFAVVVVHCFLLAHFFGGWSKVLSSEPLLFKDHGWHFYYSVLGSDFLSEHGSTWGYDPFLMAGYPTDVFDISDRFFKVAMAMVPWLAPEASFKFAVFFTAALVPLLFYVSSLWFGLGHRLSSVCSALGVWLWWTAGSSGMFVVGMAGFLLCSIYGVFFAALFFRALQRPSPLFWGGLFIAAPFTILTHPGIVPLAAVPCAVFYLMRAKRLSIKDHALIAGAVVFTVLANLFWIVPQIMNLRYAIPVHSPLQNPLMFVGIIHHSLRELQVALPVVLAAGVYGLLRMRKEDQNESSAVIFITVLVLGLLFLIGTYLPVLKNVQPVRYGIPLLFFLVFPATAGLRTLWEAWRKKQRPAYMRLAAAFALLLIAASAAAFPVMSFSKTPDIEFVGMNERVQQIKEFLERETDNRARVLMEAPGPYSYKHIYGSIFATSVLAYYSGREMANAPHYSTHIQHSIVDLNGFILFGKPVQTWDKPSLAKAMDLYNIGWVGVYSPRLLQLFDAFPGLFSPMGNAGEVKFYRVAREQSFFLEGSGKVRASLNRISLKGVSAENGRAVISYHFHPRLRVSGAEKLVRVEKGFDPVGFIGIINPGSEVEIFLDYWY